MREDAPDRPPRHSRSFAGFPVNDLALAAAFSVIALASVLTGNPAEGPLAVTIPVALAMSLALAWRTRSPITVIAILIVAGFAQTLLAEAPGSLWSLAVYAIAMYTVAAHCAEARAAVAGGAFVAALLVQERMHSGVDYLFIVLLFGGLWLLGRASRYWRGRVRTAERAQRDAARLAAAQERLRIARELHDVLAHSLSVIAVQSDAAEAALVQAPARALEPVRAIRTTARAALGDIRAMLDILRSDDGDGDGASSPGMDAIAALVDSARERGLAVDYRVRGTRSPVAPAVELAVYRIVQECLTNVTRHAPGAPTEVRLEQTRNGVDVTVQNGPSPHPPAADERSGYGLTGIDERVRSLHGALSAGPAPDGGFSVRVHIPIPVPAAPVREGAT
jgi:signal transduction histidine kinase